MGDLAAIVALERTAFEAPHWSAGQYREALGGGWGRLRRRVFVWDGDGGVVGNVVVMVLEVGGGSTGEIENLAVMEVARRGGIGRALCRAAVAWCVERGVAEVGLEVRVSNVAAIGLYEGMGFRVVGRRVRYYRGPVEDALTMRLVVGAEDAAGGR